VIASAPGKLVLSGAYSVLEGAPCLVAAVRRYVVADGDKPADFVTDEVREAVAMGAVDRAVWFDASALREPTEGGGSRKLGLGSSAAILAASMAACLRDRFASDEALREAIFPLALAAHRKAQNGGSGVDVAASVFGGVLLCQLGAGNALSAAPHALPEGALIEVFASPVSASTRDLLTLVRVLARAHPQQHRACMDAASEGAREAVAARTVPDLVRAVSAQTDALAALGDAAGASIVTPEVHAVRRLAEAEGGTFAASGAGGGDIAFYLGDEPSSAALRARAAELGLTHVDMQVGGPGAGDAALRCGDALGR
jgi:phosphomevalonate kinase